MIYLKKNVGFWQFGDRLFLDVYVPLLFASTVDVHISFEIKCILLIYYMNFKVQHPKITFSGSFFF